MSSSETTPPLAAAPPQTTWPASAAGHEITVFVQTFPYIKRLLADIREARDRIWIETYILGADPVGREVVAALTERAAAGLDVRLMLDSVGSYDAPAEELARFTEAGGKLHYFHSLKFVLGMMRLPLFNRRNHRKLALIDDRACYFGGMNLTDPSHDNRSAAWHDVHLRVCGPVTAKVEAIMRHLWLRAHLRRTPQPKWETHELFLSAGEALLPFDTWPLLPRRRASRVFKTLIRGAKRSITISMAYFIPYGGVLKELLRARRRGVAVRVIVPSESDVPLVHWATEHFYARLLKHRIRVYERKQHMLHGKVMLVDNQWSLVGSCNLDARSLRWNLEFVAAIRSADFNGTLQQVISQELRDSVRVTRERVAGRTWLQRLKGQFAWWMRDWL